MPLFSYIFIFWTALCWLFWGINSGYGQYDLFKNCPHYSALDICAWYHGSHTCLVGIERHLYPTPLKIKGRNHWLGNREIADVKWLAQITKKSLYDGISSMIKIFNANFHDPITHGVFTKCKMVAEIADFDTKYYINPEKT